MKLVQSTMFALAMVFAAPSMACDCAKNANTCTKDKDGKMACGDKDKKCSCQEGEKCECKTDSTKKAS